MKCLSRESVLVLAIGLISCCAATASAVGQLPSFSGQSPNQDNSIFHRGFYPSDSSLNPR